MPTDRPRPGRPTKYDPIDMPPRAEAWAKHGLTLDEIAPRLGVSRATLVRWKARYPELDVAIQAGWDEATDQVVGTLFRRAVGADYTDIKLSATPKGVTISQVHRSRHPRYRAVALWLAKHCPEEWGPDVAGSAPPPVHYEPDPPINPIGGGSEHGSREP